MSVRRMLFWHYLNEGEEAFRNKVEGPFQSAPGHGRKSYKFGHCTRRTGLSLSTLCGDKAQRCHWLAEKDAPFR